jgi:hypothetical protein
MKIRYENTVDDVLALWRHHLKHSPVMRTGLRLLCFVPFAVLAAVGGVAAVDRQNPIYSALIERTDEGGRTVTIQDVQAITSTESHTFICLSGRRAIVIPRRCLPEEEFTAFVDAARREWEQAAYQAELRYSSLWGKYLPIESAD